MRLFRPTSTNRTKPASPLPGAFGTTPLLPPSFFDATEDAINKPYKGPDWQQNTTAKLQQALKAPLTFQAQPDTRHYSAAGWRLLWEKGRLWAGRKLPGLNPVFYQEQQRLAQCSNPARLFSSTSLLTQENLPLASSASLSELAGLLLQTQQYLRQWDTLSTDSWKRLSFQLAEPVGNDLRERLQEHIGEPADKKALLNGLLSLLNRSEGHELHSLAVTAYQQHPVWLGLLKSLQESSDSPPTDSFQQLVFTLITQLTRLTLEQANWLSLTLGWQRCNRQSFGEGAFWRVAPSQLQLRRQQLERLQQRVPQAQGCFISWQIRLTEQAEVSSTHQAKPLENAQGTGKSLNFIELSWPVKDQALTTTLLEAAYACYVETSQTAEALLALLQTVLNAHPSLQSPTGSWLLKRLKALQSGPVWSAGFSVFEAMPAMRPALAELTPWLEEAAEAQPIRLMATARLSALLKDEPAQLMQLQQRLKHFALDERPIQTYAWRNGRALKQRLESNLLNSDSFMLALLPQWSQLSQASYREAPTFTLIGPPESGKTFVAAQLAKALNTSVAYETLEHTAEAALVPEALWSHWQACRVSFAELARQDVLVAFKHRLHDWLLSAHQQAMRHPERPFVMVWENLEALCAPPFAELKEELRPADAFEEEAWVSVSRPVVKRVSHLQTLYDVLKELKQDKRYTSPFTGETWHFPNLVMVFTLDASAMQEPSPSPERLTQWHPLLRLESADPGSAQLFCTSSRVMLEPVGWHQWHSWLSLWLHQVAKPLAARKLYSLNYSEAFVQGLGSQLREVTQSLREAQHLLHETITRPLACLPLALGLATPLRLEGKPAAQALMGFQVSLIVDES